MKAYLTGSMPLRMFGFSLFYLAQGIPIGLVTIALPAWLAAQGVQAAQIATIAAITGLPWGLKLISGPFMDRFSFAPMGRRRPWVMAAQAGLTIAMFSLTAIDDPAQHIWQIIVMCTVINTFAAVQDVAVDGMAIDVLPEDERGRANAFMAFGQVVGFSAFGALNGYLLVAHGLAVTAIVSGSALALVFAFATAARERHNERVLPWTAGEETKREQPPSASFFGIFKELLRALLLPMSLVLVGVEVLARASAGIAISISPTLAVQELGFSSEQYAYWIGIMGGASAFVGILFGPLIDRFGAVRLLQVGLVFGGVTAAAFASVQWMWGELWVVLGALILSNLSSQLVFVATIAMFMGVCWEKVAATQFAVYMSLSNLSRSMGAGAFAFIAADVSYAQAIYLIAVLLVGAAVLLALFDPLQHQKAIRALAA
jgi:PAT family beta-lactamase induction signal transducer AmpG